MSTHIAPEATQSSTKRPSCACTASAMAFRWPSGSIRPAEVSTCGANTTAGLVSRMVLTISSSGAGANGSVAPGCARRALSTVDEEATPAISKICVQR